VKTKSPAFQFYPDAWLSSRDVNLMSIAEEGAYHRLLCWAWLDPECGLPDEDKQLAQLSRLGRFWNRSAAIIRAKFRAEGGRLFNDRLLQERKKQESWREKSSDAGKKSANQRSTKPQPNANQYDNQTPTNVQSKGQPKGNSSSSSLSLNQSQSQNHGQPTPLAVSVDDPPFNTLDESNPCEEEFNAAVLSAVKKTEKAAWFDRWWLLFWRHEAKKAAKKSFHRHVTSEAKFQRVMAATTAQKREMMEREKKHRPQGASWLNGERWEDEIHGNTARTEPAPPEPQGTPMTAEEAEAAEREFQALSRKMAADAEASRKQRFREGRI
jgi:uncharacterized protein YdaU (DUF1376 family)